jgi:hypothetical protein
MLTGNTSGGVSVVMLDGKVVSGDVVPLNFAWTATPDSCPPVLYSVYVEYYHCHTVSNVNDIVSYLNAGWCEWQPYSYQTISNTTFQVNFDIGRVLLEMHSPFFTNLGWQVPANGPFTVIYQPQWVRLRVYAHDGNGNTSPGDNEMHYYVLYAKDLAIGDLNDIPMSPFR